MKKIVGLMVLALVGAGVWYVYTARNAPPEVSVVTPHTTPRATFMISSVITVKSSSNGA